MNRSTAYAELNLLPEGILQLTLEKGLRVDGETMRQLCDAAWDFAPGRHPVLLDCRGSRGMSREAREVSTTGQAAAWTSAMAVVVDSLVGRAVAAVMLFLAHPPFPTRLFGSIAPARAWLEETRASSLRPAG